MTTAEGVGEDNTKCFKHTYMGDFNLSDRELRKKGINCIGDLLVQKKNYCKFKDWMAPLVARMHDNHNVRSAE